jgi:hypothetical protein
MIFNRSSLGQAFAAVFPEPEQAAAAERISACVDDRAAYSFCNPDALTWLGAGKAMAAALLDGAPAETNAAVVGMKLHGALMELSGCESLMLKPDDVMEHPLFMDWIGMDVSEAFAAALRAGAFFGLWAVSAPSIHSVELIITNGLPSATANYSFPAKDGRWIRLSAYYGATADVEAICTTTSLVTANRRLSGDAIVAIGANLRAFGSASDHHVTSAAAQRPAPVVSTVH